MTPKLVYTLNAAVKTYTFSPSDYSSFLQEWEADEIEYKNPFTGEKTFKRRGYYYKATIGYDAAGYDLMDDMKDLFDVAITDRKFYPDTSNTNEFYDVDVNDKISTEDSDVAQAVKNFEIVFRGKKRFDSPLNQPVGFWGNRRETFAEHATELFSEYI